MRYFSSGCELHLLTCQADLQHADVAGGIPGPMEELGGGHHEDIWLCTGTFHITLSTLFPSLCSAWSMAGGCSVSPRIALVVGHLSAEQGSSTLQPGCLAQLGHSSSQCCSLGSASWFWWSGWAPYLQRFCIHGKVFENLSTSPTSVCSSGLIPWCLA